ncbi:PAS domain-containing protein [Helicobacter canis]|uniref:PAS domain-containing protein n=1 Tax=Helicobacter canis TaxID=29419 RepID=A0A5M9QUJ0_9HELI|nr:PAS domain-containing protein [Helicobacter canis]KAA8710735.1 PAS domain-containing protein [Helicobacter canis]
MSKQHTSLQRDPHFGLIIEPDTLITSKTDLKGVITYCNRDFLAYSGYGEEELIGKPHNIIRHKDMPACVFKLLWDYIQSGREIFAFVKNLTKHKEHYWVFTNVTPSFDNLGNIIGYYSVRRAPNLAVIPTIEALYKDLCALESKGGYEHSLKALQEFVQAQNKSYNHIICDLQKIDS